jgi:hypothetical protein
MYIRAAKNGEIELVSREPLPDTIPFTGIVPDDFYEGLLYGKYLFTEQQIVEAAPDVQIANLLELRKNQDIT